MQRYDIYNQDGQTIRMRGVGIRTAARIAAIDPDDIRWAIDEEARCDGAGIVVVEAGDPAPGVWDGLPG